MIPLLELRSWAPMRRLLRYEENDPVAFSCILFALADGVVISCDAICLRKVGHRYLAEVPYSCGSTQDEPEIMPTDQIRAIISGLPVMGREHSRLNGMPNGGTLVKSSP